MAAPASTPLDVFERITAQEAAERFTECGLGPVTIRWNDPDSGGEDILVATAVKSATDEQLRCADKAVSYYTLELRPEIQRRFEVLREARLAPVFLAQARSWLSARGLLNRVPEYREGETDDAPSRGKSRVSVVRELTAPSSPNSDSTRSVLIG